MKAKVNAFESAYRQSLQECIAGAGEIALQHGYELGRRAVRDGLGVMDILSIQRKALAELLAGSSSADECMRITESAYNLFTECLAPFEMTHRGFLEVESLNSKLEAANRELESFSYSVSHDLRAPLRAIDGYIRMILKKQEQHFDKETQRHFHSIRDNVQTMGRLIEDLLAFSRFGRREMSEANLDMEGIIKDVWQNLVTANPERTMSLHVEEVRPAIGDRTLIREVFSNLLGNAVKFSRHRDVTRIEAGSRVNESETIYYVRDNGVGFDMKYHDKLFSVFQRLHSPDEYEGTGVGLAIVQRIIHRHGGRVWAESEVGAGATFHFTLPTRNE